MDRLKHILSKMDCTKVIAVVFITMIFTIGTITLLTRGKIIAYNMLIGYKESLPENSSIFDHIKGIISSCETSTNKVFIAKNILININGILQRVMSKKIVEDVIDDNTIYKMDNGQITWAYSNWDIEQYVTNVSRLKEFLDNYNIPLLYVQALFKLDKYNNELPYGLFDNTNKTTDDFLQGIQKAGVNILDLREEIKEENILYQKLFFNTDHHWKPETGLWATKEIAIELEEQYAFMIDKDLLELNNYNITTYRQCFLGSQGKRVGIGYAGIDDINLIIPQYDTSFEFSIPSENIVRTGDYKNTMLFMENLNSNDYFASDPYCVYTNGDKPLITVKNNNSTNNKKVLLIKDSFSCVVIPFLIETCKQLDIIDLRHYEEMSLVEYVKNTIPDIVIMLYNPSILLYEESRDKVFKFN